jgi:hypothetical protein
MSSCAVLATDGATFDATLTNPTPGGEIGTRGTFGPLASGRPEPNAGQRRVHLKVAHLSGRTQESSRGSMTCVKTSLERNRLRGDVD